MTSSLKLYHESMVVFPHPPHPSLDIVPWNGLEGMPAQEESRHQEVLKLAAHFHLPLGQYLDLPEKTARSDIFTCEVKLGTVIYLPSHRHWIYAECGP